MIEQITYLLFLRRLDDLQGPDGIFSSIEIDQLVETLSAIRASAMAA